MMNKEKEKLAQVFHFDLYGKREDKYDFLNEKSFSDIEWNEVEPSEPNYFFVPKNEDNKEEYEKGFSVVGLFPVNGVGLTTAHDEFVIKENKDELLKFFNDFQNSERNADLLHQKFNVNKKEGWNILNGYDNIKQEKDVSKFIKPISYRPFDNRFVFYEDKLVWRTVRKIMQHFLKDENVGLVIGRQGQVVGSMTWNLSFIVNSISDLNLFYRGGGQIFPLYLYPESGGKMEFDVSENRVPNLNMEIVNEIKKQIGEFEPINLLDYIYAVLHSPNYREKYAAFLKIDFPRVPYPKNTATFWLLVKLGEELRQIHLLDKMPKLITQYPMDGNNVVEKITFQNGKVYINNSQYFDNVPEIVWNFYIGGYQPAQKWLKDRKNHSLQFEDILHYQKIIVALSETERIMREIDGIKE